MLASLAEKDMVVLHEARGPQPAMQSKLPLENCRGARSKRNSTIFSGLGQTALNTGDACLVDADNPVYDVKIGENECNPFRRPEASEESELVIVALSFPPVAVDGSDERFGVLHANRIDLGAVLLFQPRTSKTARRIVLLGMVAVTELDGSSQDADGIVVRLLAPRLAVRNRDQLGVTDLMKELPADCREPNTIQDSSIGPGCRRGQIVRCQLSFTVRKELVKDLAARANRDCSANSTEESVVRKLLGK
jgi:hypothetical protein